ncbi:MAG: hypothetical protein QXG33_02840 [Candidatus Anstonellales archaeon]
MGGEGKLLKNNKNAFMTIILLSEIIGDVVQFRRILFLFLFLFFSLIGCISQQSQPPPVFNLNEILQPSDQQRLCQEPSDPQNPCKCYVCTVSTNSSPSAITEASLEGQRCLFIGCNGTPESYIRLLNPQRTSNPIYVINFFAFGGGPDFESFSVANRYCNNMMNLPAMWINPNTINFRSNDEIGFEQHEQVGTIDSRDIEDYVKSYLQNHIIPMFILYSDNGTINDAKLEDFASLLNSTGPVYISTQPTIMTSTTPALSIRHARTIKRYCQKCLVILSYSPDNMNYLNYSITPSDNVDFLGMEIIIDPNDIVPLNCNLNSKLIQYMWGVRENLARYRKPTFWSIFAIKEGISDDRRCEISSQQVGEAYDLIFQSAQSLAAYGLSGISLLSFSDRLPPYLSAYTGVGLFRSDGSQKNPQLNFFFDWCNYYYTNKLPGGFESEVDYSKNLISLVYQPELSIPHCAFAMQTNLQRRISHSTGPYTPPSLR